MDIKKCLKCGQILQLKGGKKRINPSRKFCSGVCRRRDNALKKYHKKYKYDEEYKERQKSNMREWYKKNKKRQYKNILNDYKKHKKEWKERNYVKCHRKEILKILSNFCIGCGKKKVQLIHHKTYNFPKKDYNRRDIIEKRNYLIQYCKKLLPFCSVSCHRKYESELEKGKA